MKIAINLLPFTSYQGTETFTVNLIKELIKAARNEQVIIIKHNFSPEWLKFEGENVENVTINFNKNDRKILALYQQFKFYFLLKKINPNILFCPSPIGPFFYKKKVVVIHDCAYSYFPEFKSTFSKIYFKLMYFSAKHFSKAIITVSEFSKKELIEHYGIKPEKIVVVYEGVPKLPDVDDNFVQKVVEKFKLDHPYFLYVGNTRPRKNIIGLLNGFKFFLQKHSNCKLVLAGRIDNQFLNIKEKIKSLKLEEGVIQTDFILDEEKVVLYKRAIALLFPSFYEGFGIPVIEAQSLGVPVITSNTSSLPEIGGNSVLYVNPYNINEISESMEKLFLNEDLRKNLIKKGYQNIKRFSYEKVAEKLLKHLR